MGKTATLANIGSVADSSLGFRNRIINGAMVIDQRNAGAAIASPSDNYTTDRFYSRQVGGGVASAQQSSTAPAGFTNSLLFTVTTVDSSLSAGDRYYLAQFIEGYNIADLGWGTASAATVTLSFWVRSSLTGTFGGALNNGGTRSYPFTYTISSANTWTQASVTIAGDTSGTWATTNGMGLQVFFSLGAGSSYIGTAGSWSSNNYLTATGATNVIATNGATFYITGVQLEKGATATSFDYRDYGTEFGLCQRYAQVYTYTTSSIILFGGSRGTTRSDGVFNFPVMRASPTITLPAVGSSTGQATFLTGSFSYPGMTGTLSTFSINTSNASVYQSGDTGFTAGQVSAFYSSGGCTITFSAEL
jgi:hypothetical protein